MKKKFNKAISDLRIYFSGKLTFKKFIPGISWFFILLILLCLPAKDLPKTDWWLDKIYFDKWVHIGLFGLLAILFTAPVFASDLQAKRKWIYVIIIGCAGILWGITTEFIQDAFIEKRSFDHLDWMADSLGTIIAIFLSKYLFFIPSLSSGPR